MNLASQLAVPHDDGLVRSVTLSFCLARARLRRALQPQDAGAEGDQRRHIGLAGLASRLQELPAALAAERDACRAEAVRSLDVAAKGGLVPLAWDDPTYPSHLAEIDDPPAVLWLRGDPAALSRPGVAIVGSRAASSYAVAVAEQVAGDLGRRGVAVVSGLARGVDAAAHTGALAGGGATIAVLGSGADVVYPSEHVALADRIAGAAAGALVSELPPGSLPLPRHFPRRNRLISGLSRAVVVVEATTRSGSLITARCAAEQGREVMAVPGNVLSDRSRGAHALLRDGARLVETAKDILEELGWPPGGAAADPTASAGDVSDPVLRHMDPAESCSVDDLVARSGLDGMTLLARLTDLEVEGRVVRVAGGRFVRTPDVMLT